jgi:adenine/guanine phosphoribosyltransferase-like PRPP-binding protein
MTSERQATTGHVLLPEKIASRHRERLTMVYLRQSTPQQMKRHQESTRLEYALVDLAVNLGWQRERVIVVSDDLGLTGSTIEGSSWISAAHD